MSLRYRILRVIGTVNVKIGKGEIGTLGTRTFGGTFFFGSRYVCLSLGFTGFYNYYVPWYLNFMFFLENV